VETPEEAAKVMKVQLGIGKNAGANEEKQTRAILFANPAPRGKRRLRAAKIDAFIAAAIGRLAETAGVRGKDGDPVSLLQEVARLSGGKNVAGQHRTSCCEPATLAGQIAVSYHAHGLERRNPSPNFFPFIPTFFNGPSLAS